MTRRYNMDSFSTDSPRKGSTPYSKTVLYTSLQAYDQHGAPSSSADKLKRMPSTAKATEKVAQFFHEVSVNYHSNCQTSEARSCAGRPMSMEDSREKIAQKSLTLVGAYNANPFGTFRKKSRKKRNTTKRKPAKITPTTLDMEFLSSLNNAWLCYMKKLIGSSADVAPEAVSSRLEKVRIEWVGAHVRIQSSKARPKLAKEEGILVQDLVSVWVVAPQGDKSARPTYLLPKKGTHLVAIVSVGNNSTDTGKAFLVTVR